MKIPNKIVVKGKIWSIQYRWRLHDAKLGYCDGLTDWLESTIWLDRILPKEEKLRVLLHEIIHIILDEYHMHETGGIKEDFAEEVVCAGVSKTLLEIFNMKFKDDLRHVIRPSKRK